MCPGWAGSRGSLGLSALAAWKDLTLTLTLTLTRVGRLAGLSALAAWKDPLGDSYTYTYTYTYRVGRLAGLSALAAWKDPLGDSFRRRPFSREPTAFGKGRAAVAMASLRKLSETGCGYLGVSSPAMIAHFPEVPSVLDSHHVSIDGPGSYERFVLSALH